MFEQRDSDDNFTDRATICGAIIDWADSDEDLNPCDPSSTAPSSRANEDISYQLLKKPYFRKNAAFDSLEELHLVRGVSDDFWATFVDPEPEKPKKRVMTVWGQGAVNVNSANAQTLLALVLAGSKKSKMWSDLTEMQNFLMRLTLIRTVTAGIPMFGSGQDFVNAMQGQGKMKLRQVIGIKAGQIDVPDGMNKAVT